MNDNTIQSNSQLIFLGAALATPNGQYAIKKAAIVGYHSYFMCPKCGRPVMIMAEKEGFTSYPCKHCATEVIVKGVTRDKINPKPAAVKSQTQQQPQQPKQQPLQQPQQPQPQQPKTDNQQPDNSQTPQPKPKTERFNGHKVKSNARIQWGGLISRKSCDLHEGENWIGRWDAEEPSDIMVKDQYMSRRSVLIEVIRQNDEFLFKFTVKRCSNPVSVNGKKIEEGQCIYLNFEDRIEMGDTMLFIKKAKNK